MLSSWKAAGLQGTLLQAPLAVTVDVSVHALTWLLCRQSQLRIQVWTVVGVYSAFVLLSAATNPVQTNAWEQKKKKHENDTGSEYNHETKQALTGVHTALFLYECLRSHIYGRYYISVFSLAGIGRLLFICGTAIWEQKLILVFWLFPCFWHRLCCCFFLFLSC